MSWLNRNYSLGKERPEKERLQRVVSPFGFVVNQNDRSFYRKYEANRMYTVGENINEAERLAAEKVGCKYAVALSCDIAALHMA